MEFITNHKSKSILAKLLATEDIRVEVKNTRSAYFDLTTRTVVIPSWKDISQDIYDLFIGHEIGHALFTPKEGWHSSIEAVGKEFKSYLNIIEDVRIEKLIKSKYPGLKTAFYRGYNELNQKDFFGIKTNSTKIRLFIDRINLHYKIGSMCNISFSSKEEEIIEDIEAIKSWDDVVRIAKKIFEYDKLNQNLFDSADMNLDFDELEYDDDPISEDFIPYNKIPDDSLPMAQTDEFFRNKMETLTENDKRLHYTVNIPRANLDNIIVSHKSLYEHINTHFTANELETFYKDESNACYRKFLSKNKTHIQYLIKEFELRRNAKQFARAKVSKTGELDTKKAFSYKFKDDIFKQITTVPNGKSHGLVMFIDLSGSMADIIKETIEQTVVLAIFCRRLNIPFKIYGFSDNYTSALTFSKKNAAVNDYPKFSEEDGEYGLNTNSQFHLKEYLSNDMTNKEFINAVKAWLFIARSYNNSSRAGYDLNSENLSNTPLQHAVVSAMDIIPKFKEANKLDIINTILLTDGESSSPNCIYGAGGINKSLYVHESVIIHLNHRKTGKTITIKDGNTITNGLIQIFRELTDTRVIGFYLLNKSMPIKRGIVTAAKANGTFVSELDDAAKQARKEKVYCLESLGYDKNFVVPSLEIDDESLDIDKEKSKSIIRNAFIRLRRNKNSNRILLNKFIEKIA